MNGFSQNINFLLKTKEEKFLMKIFLRKVEKPQENRKKKSLRK